MTQPNTFSVAAIAMHQNRLNRHPLYDSLQNLDDLRLFMSHHIYPVWDFMSLVKYLQSKIAPAAIPWRPRGSGAVRYFINEIVLAEESDECLPDANGASRYMSHFELYCDAMREVGADPSPAIHLAEVAVERGIVEALALPSTPAPARQFMESTFAFIATGKPHVAAAAFALGREHIIPEMFRALLAKMNITDKQAPAFHYYLNRHIHLDEDYHAPLSLKMVNELIAGDATRLREAEEAARSAVDARLALWDGVLEAIDALRKPA